MTAVDHAKAESLARRWAAERTEEHDWRGQLARAYLETRATEKRLRDELERRTGAAHTPDGGQLPDEGGPAPGGAGPTRPAAGPVAWADVVRVAKTPAGRLAIIDALSSPQQVICSDGTTRDIPPLISKETALALASGEL